MITGAFDNRGRPRVIGEVTLPRLRIDGVEVLFLVDTGADATSIHTGFGRDGVRIPFEQLSGRRSFRGVGGSSQYFSEPAVVSFSDDGLERYYEIDLFIAEPNDANAGLPSLLGRNILNNWYMRYDPSNRRLDFRVRYADRTGQSRWP